MKKVRTSPQLRSFSFFVCLLLSASLLAVTAADYFRATADFSPRWPTSFSSFSSFSRRFPALAAAMMQTGTNCMNGLGFAYAPGFAPDPATGERPISVVSGDFNKDGKLDLVASNIFGNSLSVLLGDGTGGFGMATNIPVVSDSQGFPSGLTSADFDGDGNLDLAVAIEFNPGRVFLMSGNGAGNFTFTAALNTGVNTRAVGTGDLNGDSKADLVVVSSGDTTLMLPGTVSVYFNNGTGAFGTPTMLTPGTMPVAVAIGEFSGDAQPDIIVVNAGSNNFSYFVNTSGGTFAEPALRNTGLNPRGIIAGFFNGDTRLDVAVTNAGSDTVSVFMANGVGDFSVPNNLTAGTTPSGIVTNDFNGDGRADLAYTNLLANQVSVMLNNGSGGFNTPLTTSVGADPLSLATGDFNADTKADLAVANSSASNLSILLGQNNGSFSRTTFLFSTPQAVVIEDFNKDDRQDLAVANFGGDKVTIFLADAGGSYSMPNEVGVGIKPASLVTGDFNKDSNPDIAVANNGSNNVSLLLGNGTGGFGTHTTFTVGTQPRAITVADFTRDGNLDLATANEGSNDVSFLRGNGDGTFLAATTLAAGVKPVALDNDDFNADDTPDLAVANSDSSFVTILLSNGTGGFIAGANVNLPGGAKGISIAAADLNKNGRADLAVGLAGSNQIAIALGNAGAVFQTPTVVTSGGTTPSEIVINDFDGDSHGDLAVANQSSATISLLRGKGDGTFEAAKNFGVGVGPIALDHGDLNNDQRVDLAVINQLSNSLSLLLNTCANTPPSITPAPTLTRTQGGTAINATIATVNDFESAAGSLTVSAFPPAGVSVTNIVNTNGAITASVAAECTTLTGNKVVTLEVVDGNGLSTLSTITVNVTANTAPVLGNYTGLEIANGAMRSFTPSAAPTDNGTVQTITAAATTPGFTGTFSVNPTTGVLTVSNAGPVGLFDVTVTATDNCGLTSMKTAQLKVVALPVITTLDPTTKQAQTGEFTLMVNGSGFTANAKVLWNGAERATTFVSATKLTATILASDINLNLAGTANVTVTDPAAGGITSNAVVFNISAPNPVPAIAALDPTSATAGGAGFTLTINGSNFVSSSVVKYNGVDRATTFVSATQLTIAVTAADIASPGSATLAVFSPTPGGGTSGTVNLPINNPAPGAITLNPNSVIAGSAAITLIVNGAGFRPDSVIRVNGNDRVTTVVSTTQLTTPLTVADLATAGTLKITVNTPPPGGGLSPEATFSVNNPAPVLTTLDPALVLAGSADFTLKLNGTGFVNGSQVKVNGTDRATTFVAATQLSVALTAADVANTGMINFTVVNAAPGGGTSNQLSLPINNPVPTLTSLNPTSAAVGSAATAVTLTGTNYRPNSVVRVNGSDRATTFDSTTQLKITLTADDLLNPATLKLSVFTPTPGGGTTTELNFTVGNPVPVLANLSPNSATAGGAAFTLAINGTGFLASSTVKFNGVDRAATFVNSTQLTIAMTADDIKNAGSAKVVVTNPPPVGGTSNELSLPINNPPPVATTLSQDTLNAGAGATMLTITGSGFRPDSVARVNGTDRATTFVSATELKVTLLGSDVASGAVLKITVNTPTPGGGTSGELTVTVNNPAPTLTSLNPNSAFKSDPAFTLTVTGTNFVPTSVVRWNGVARATTFVSTTQLTAAIPASDLANDGMTDVTVFNPTPVGGTSSAVKFTINPLTGFEADVTPRPNGDGTISIADWVLVGRFASGLETPQNSSEFQRADCAPTATSGDGRITIADWVQAGRYAVGLDPRVPAGGPSQPITNAQAQALETEAAAFAEAQPELTRIVRARSGGFVRGQLNALPLELEAQGNENGLSFSLHFDAKQLLFSHAEAPEGWSLNVNSEQRKQGKVGVMAMLTAGHVVPLGKQQFVTLYFAPLGGTEAVTTEIKFDDQVFARDIADAKAATLPKATYENARLTITGRGFASVRAASYVGPDVAADSIASAFGIDLATDVASAATAPLPETLGGTSVKVTDSKGVTKSASLFFVSPSQVNYLLPAGLADGIAQVTITNRAGVVSRGAVLVKAIAPSVFTADATGKGWAAADVVRVLSNGKQAWERAYRFDPGDNKFVAVPIDLGPERGKESDKVFLVLYATGIRQHGDLRKVKLKIGEAYVSVEYAGQQGGYAGLDQLNALIPRTFLGRGIVPVELIIDGQVSNQVKVQIR